MDEMYVNLMDGDLNCLELNVNGPRDDEVVKKGMA